MADTSSSITAQMTADDWAELIAADRYRSNIRLIGDLAVWLLPVDGWTYDGRAAADKQLPTLAGDGTPQWTPPSRPVGWMSSDGVTLSYKPGETTIFPGFNGEPAHYVTQPGNWTLKLEGLETRLNTLQAYFGSSVYKNQITYSPSRTVQWTMWDVILAGIDTDDRPVIIELLNAEVTARDDLKISGRNAVTIGLTFTPHPYQGAQSGQGGNIDALDTELRILGLDSDRDAEFEQDKPAPAPPSNGVYLARIIEGARQPILRVEPAHTIVSASNDNQPTGTGGVILAPSSNSN